MLCSSGSVLKGAWRGFTGGRRLPQEYHSTRTSGGPYIRARGNIGDQGGREGQTKTLSLTKSNCLIIFAGWRGVIEVKRTNAVNGDKMRGEKVARRPAM